MKLKNLISFIAILVILGINLWQILNAHRYTNPKSLIAWDIKSYYAYLPATFIEKDYKLQSVVMVIEDGFIKYWPETAPNGGHVIKTTMGMSILYAPFFFMAHAVAEAMGYEANGFTTPYAFALIFSCLFYLVIGFFVLRFLLLKYFKDIIVALTLLIIGLATNLRWYSYAEPLMPHAYNFVLFCIFLFLIEKWYAENKWSTTIFIGLLVGLIALVRPTNGVIVILFLLYNITNWKDLQARVQLFFKNYKKIIVMTVCAILVWIPQLLYWKSITGNWLFYSYANNERFFFNNPHILSVLFGFRKGWLIYTPVMIFALIGVGMLWKTNKKYFYPTVLFLVINLYIVSSWWCWWYGGGFGLRALIESYAVLAIPLATFLAWLARQKLRIRIPLIVVVSAITLLSAFHTLRYHYGSIHWGNMTKEAYFDSFWRVRASEKFDSLLFAPDYQAAKEGKSD